jgi:hypothetical protein
MTNYPTTIVYDDYWRFAAERQSIYLKRNAGQPGPWTQDPILATYKFTNAYRASDRVSQYLIREVQYGEGRSQSTREVYFRTMLFKLFNKIETWEMIEAQTGPIKISTGLDTIQLVLDHAFAAGKSIYSAAYIMAMPQLGETRKHTNHLRLLDTTMASDMPFRLADSASLQEAYEMLLALPGLGKFLAFQYAIDLNYSTVMNHDEAEFVVAGPGALDGISKCFNTDLMNGGMVLTNKALPDDQKAIFKENFIATPEEIIHHMVDIQDQEFARLGLDFPGLYGRKLQPIDCQNLFCEISKYARVAHPTVVGANTRTKIKQNFKQHASAVPAPFFPPKWNLSC